MIYFVGLRTIKVKKESFRTLNKFRTYIAFALLLFLVACTNKKNTVVTRNYHNLTSRFNGLFNAEQSFKDGVSKLEKGIKEDYTKVLPLYVYGTTADAKNILPELDKAFKKASMVVERHSIRIKGIEYCKWIDETYLLIGKTHLYKHDYFPAIEAFTYVADGFKKNPNRYVAKIFLIRSHNEMGNMTSSQDIIDELKGDKKFPKKEYAEEMAIAEADMYMRQRNSDPALKLIQKAIKDTKTKKNKIRYNFVLAQMLEERGDVKKAANHYEEVIKMHPANYEMAFYAKLFHARCLDANAKNAKNVKKQLIKMSKDGKNEEYQDQIFRTLSEIELKEGNKPAAVDYLKKSITASKSGGKQKGISCLKLADLYYEDSQYLSAAAFYDSATTFLPKDYPGYSSIDNKKKNLSKLVAYTDTVKSGDSLMALSKMSEKEIKQIVDKEIKKRVDEYYKIKQQMAEAARQAEMQSSNTNAPSTLGGNQTGAWYFYNATTLAFGMNDFTKKWGNRKLEDNWRRKDKQNASGDEGAAVAQLTDEEIDKMAIDKIKEPEQYLKKIPKGDSAYRSSAAAVERALYNLGIIYIQQLENKTKSVESFEELLKRFPNTENKLTVYYQLYRIFIASNNQPKSEYYKNLLLKDDPNSEFSKLITNPDFNVGAEGAAGKAEKMYQESYSLYNQKQYATVIENCQLALKSFNKSKLLPKFDLLNALATGKMNGPMSMEPLLKAIVLKYPSDPVREEAQNILALLNKNKAALSAADTVKKQISLYEFNKDTLHYFIMVFSSDNTKYDGLSSVLATQNQKLFETSNLLSNTLFFNDQKNALLVKSFENKEKAQMYYVVMKDNEELFAGVDKSGIEVFIISANNFQVLMREKKTQDYLKFFTEKYLTVN